MMDKKGRREKTVIPTFQSHPVYTHNETESCIINQGVKSRKVILKQSPLINMGYQEAPS